VEPLALPIRAVLSRYAGARTMSRWARPDDPYGGYTETQAAIILAEAQVHAALALAAATALGNVELREWREMAGTKLNDPE